MNDGLTRSRIRPRTQNPCKCAEERKSRRISARDCLSRSECWQDPGWAEHPRRLLGSDTDFAAMQSIAPKGRAIGSANSGSDPKNLSRHQGRLFLTYLILTKQKKVSRPPRQSGTGTWQRKRCPIQSKASIPQPERIGARQGRSARSFDTSRRTGNATRLRQAQPERMGDSARTA